MNEKIRIRLKAYDSRLLDQSVRELVDTEFSKEYCREVEARESFPWDLWERLGESGLTGVGIPEEFGGQGGGILEQVIVDEELSRTMAGLYWLLGITLFELRAGRLPFLGIVDTVARVVEEHGSGTTGGLTLDDVLAADAWARTRARELTATV